MRPEISAGGGCVKSHLVRVALCEVPPGLGSHFVKSHLVRVRVRVRVRVALCVAVVRVTCVSVYQ